MLDFWCILPLTVHPIIVGASKCSRYFQATTWEPTGLPVVEVCTIDSCSRCSLSKGGNNLWGRSNSRNAHSRLKYRLWPTWKWSNIIIHASDNIKLDSFSFLFWNVDLHDLQAKWMRQFSNPIQQMKLFVGLKVPTIVLYTLNWTQFTKILDIRTPLTHVDYSSPLYNWAFNITAWMLCQCLDRSHVERWYQIVCNNLHSFGQYPKLLYGNRSEWQEFRLFLWAPRQWAYKHSLAYCEFYNLPLNISLEHHHLKLAKTLEDRSSSW